MRPSQWRSTQSAVDLVGAGSVEVDQGVGGAVLARVALDKIHLEGVVHVLRVGGDDVVLAATFAVVLRDGRVKYARLTVHGDVHIEVEDGAGREARFLVHELGEDEGGTFVPLERRLLTAQMLVGGEGVNHGVIVVTVIGVGLANDDSVLDSKGILTGQVQY